MSHRHIEIDLHFNSEPQVVFDQLTDHPNFGRIVNSKIERVRDSGSADVNGVGSVRKITIIPGISFDETIRTFERPHLMEYQITRGSPITEHWGRLVFKPSNGGCQLIYTIDFKAKIPGTGKLLKVLIERPIRRGLIKLQAALR